MQTKKENRLVLTSVTSNQEVEMKDYKLEQMNESYGSLMEEILCEVFHVEDEVDESLEGAVIYDLRSEKEIESMGIKDQQLLDGDSASLDDFSLLEEQARSYFKNPINVYTPADEINEEVVTGFIQINAGLKFSSDGTPVEIWKSFGEKVVCNVDLLYSPEEIIKFVESTGIHWNELVRVVFYGKTLERIVGCRAYTKGEKKELVHLCDSYKGIQLAIPSFDDCDTDESIFSRIDKLVKESIQVGNDLNLDRVAMGHYEMTLARLDELKLEEQELAISNKVFQFQKQSIRKRNEFDQHFKEARQTIKALNMGEIKVHQLFDKDAKFLGQMMYLCQKKGERIEKPALFFQLKALASKRKCEEIQNSNDKDALEIINKINSGCMIEVHLLDYFELEEIFNILWGGAGIRINSEYKSVYFQLKERFTHLKGVNQKLAA